MATNQLQLVANWEKEKEDKLAQNYLVANKYLQDNENKLKGLEQYRLDYLRQLQQKGSQGVGALSFGQHQSFIDKLDKACTQQIVAISKAQLVADQRKGQWLKQQQKRKAVEMLIDKKQQQKALAESRAEQQMMDEIALQKFIRNRA